MERQETPVASLRKKPILAREVIRGIVEVWFCS